MSWEIKVTVYLAFKHVLNLVQERGTTLVGRLVSVFI